MYGCMHVCRVRYYIPYLLLGTQGSLHKHWLHEFRYPGSSHERAADTGIVMKWNLTMQSRALISTIAETLFAECVQSAGHKLPGRGSKAPFR